MQLIQYCSASSIAEHLFGFLNVFWCCLEFNHSSFCCCLKHLLCSVPMMESPNLPSSPGPPSLSVPAHVWRHGQTQRGGGRLCVRSHRRRAGLRWCEGQREGSALWVVGGGGRAARSIPAKHTATEGRTFRDSRSPEPGLINKFTYSHTWASSTWWQETAQVEKSGAKKDSSDNCSDATNPQMKKTQQSGNWQKTSECFLFLILTIKKNSK